MTEEKPMTEDLVAKTAEAAADWWTERLMSGDKALFRESLRSALDAKLRESDKPIFLQCDYDPRGILLDAVRTAGVECGGSFFSADGVLPRKHDLEVRPGLLSPKEGYGNWTDPIEVLA